MLDLNSQLLRTLLHLEMVFEAVIKIIWGFWLGPESNMTGVLRGRGDQDVAPQREEQIRTWLEGDHLQVDDRGLREPALTLRTGRQ